MCGLVSSSSAASGGNAENINFNDGKRNDNDRNTQNAVSLVRVG